MKPSCQSIKNVPRQHLLNLPTSATAQCTPLCRNTDITSRAEGKARHLHVVRALDCHQARPPPKRGADSARATLSVATHTSLDSVGHVLHLIVSVDPNLCP